MKIFEYEFCRFTPTEQEIPEIDKFMAEQFGKKRSSNLEMLNTYYQYNKNSFQAVRLNSRHGKLVGFFAIQPLTKEAHELIRKGVIKNGGDFKSEHICKSFKEASAIYIGVILASTIKAKAHVISILKDELKSKIYKNSLLAIYARPWTADGLRLAKKNNFVSISAKSEIWELPLNRPVYI